MDDSPHSLTTQSNFSGEEVATRGPLDAKEAAYMQGEREPVQSSVLISNSKYLNNPYYRDAYVQHALRRHGHDLPHTYGIPMMVRAVNEMTDYPAAIQMIAEEKTKNREFADWLDARRVHTYRAEDLAGYAEGTLGARIRAFLAEGYDMEFMHKADVTSDFDYMVKRRVAVHDLEHIVSGFGPNNAGEQALSMANVATAAHYFSPDLAQFVNAFNVWVTSTSYNRNSLHYPATMPVMLEAMQRGIEFGRALKKPLFMVNWEDYLDWTLEAIAGELGVTRGPGDAWAWTSDASAG
jgi:ubiquinone biosynthesis protein COQ4